MISYFASMIYGTQDDLHNSVIMSRQLTEVRITRNVSMFVLPHTNEDSEFITLNFSCGSPKRPSEMIEKITVFCEKTGMNHSVDFKKIIWEKSADEDKYFGTYSIKRPLVQPYIIVRAYGDVNFPQITINVIEKN